MSRLLHWGIGAVLALLSALLPALLPMAAAQTLGWERVVRLGGWDPAFPSTDVKNTITATASGSNGTLYVAGIYTGANASGGGVAVFDTVAAGSEGGYEAFVACFGPGGRIKWLRTVNGPTYDGVSHLAVDADGNVTALGYCSVGALYDPGQPRTTAAGQYLARYSSTGQLLSFELLPSSGVDVEKITIDQQGNLLFTGVALGVATLGGQAIAVPAGQTQVAFVAKRRPNRTWAWASTNTTGSVARHRYFDLVVDSAGNSYMTGSFLEQFSWGGRSVTTLPLQQFSWGQGWSQYVVSLDSTGAFRWLQGYSCPNPDTIYQGPYSSYPFSIRLGLTPKTLLFTTRVWGAVRITTTAGQVLTYGPPGVSGTFTFLAKIANTTGQVRTVIPLITPRPASNYAKADIDCLVVGGPNEILVGGSQGGGITLGTGTSITPPASITTDGFVAQFDTTGAASWVVYVNGQSTTGPSIPEQRVRGVALAPDGVLAAGTFMSYPTSFPPSISLQSLDYHSPFVGKIGLVTGLPEEAELGRLVAYPNPVPAGQEVRLVPSGSTWAATHVTCYDAIGRVVRTGALGAEGRLSTAGLAPGLYVVRLHGARDGRVSTTRLVILP